MIPNLLCRLIRRKLSHSCYQVDGLLPPKFHSNKSSFFPPIRWNHSSSDPIDLSSFPPDSIRNFCIIAHVDHGKSTLSDRILEITGAIKENESNKQVLDTLQVEKERGITVKSQSASMVFSYDGKNYLLNLIDTPGHVDFSYEVSRAIAACQGVVLLVDANQGVQAQTVANFYLAFTKDLFIIPVLNKIDLKTANPEAVIEQIKNLFEINSNEVLQVSGKFGTGVEKLLQAVVDRIPSPVGYGYPDAPFRALLYDSMYDKYKGVKCQIVVKDGTIKIGDYIQSSITKKSYELKSLVMLTPAEVPVDKLCCGQVGVFTASMKNPKEAKIGDTIHKKGVPVEPLEGFKESKPMVYAGIYPMDQSEADNLKTALSKLILTDPSVTIEVESSPALGLGWRIGFLGLLHMEVFNARLEQEQSAEVLITTPSVPYKVHIKKNKKNQKEDTELIIVNPAHWPKIQQIEETFEPVVRASIITPNDRLSSVLSLCEEGRGEQIELRNLDKSRMLVVYKMPLNEVIVDFFDNLKSVSSGYATFDYEHMGYRSSNLVKLGIQLNKKPLEELCLITHESRAVEIGRQMCLKLKESLPKQQFSHYSVHVTLESLLRGKKEHMGLCLKDSVFNVIKAARGGRLAATGAMTFQFLDEKLAQDSFKAIEDAGFKIAMSINIHEPCRRLVYIGRKVDVAGYQDVMKNKFQAATAEELFDKRQNFTGLSILTFADAQTAAAADIIDFSYDGKNRGLKPYARMQEILAAKPERDMKIKKKEAGLKRKSKVMEE